MTFGDTFLLHHRSGGIIESRRVKRQPERGHQDSIPFEQDLLRNQRLQPAGHRADDGEDKLPSGQCCITNVTTLLDDEILVEKAEVRECHPVFRQRGDSHEGLQSVDYGEPDISDSMPEEREQSRCECRDWTPDVQSVFAGLADVWYNARSVLVRYNLDDLIIPD